MKTLNRFANCENGATAIEYGLIASLICVVIIGAVSQVGGNVSIMYANISTAVSTAVAK